MLEVIKIVKESDLEKAFSIRKTVFVEEQKVSETDEYDNHEGESHHFLATSDGTPCATARWRFTEKGVKLERFAVLKDFRGKKIGNKILKEVLEDIARMPETSTHTRYLHAQLTAVPFYEKEGFTKVGEMFEECNIQHFKMVL